MSSNLKFALSAALAFACLFAHQASAFRACASPARQRVSVREALVSLGYAINYEVSVGPKSSPWLDFFSASNAAAKNVVHVAMVRPGGLEPSVAFAGEISRLGDSAGSDAVLAINGGYYSLMNDRVYSVGRVMKNFKRYPYAIEHPMYPYFCVFEDGRAGLVKGSEFERVSSGKRKVRDLIQSKPMLVYDGKVPASLLKSSEAGTSRNPRTAFATVADGGYLCVVVEGRRDDVAGMSQTGLADLLIALGADRAINLDGGGSSTILLNGVLMNRTAGGFSPFTAPGEQRPIHSSIIFTPKK